MLLESFGSIETRQRLGGDMLLQPISYFLAEALLLTRIFKLQI